MTTQGFGSPESSSLFAQFSPDDRERELDFQAHRRAMQLRVADTYERMRERALLQAFEITEKRRLKDLGHPALIGATQLILLEDESIF